MTASISMLLPDTRHSKLPEVISQAKPIRRCCCANETAADQSEAGEGCAEGTRAPSAESEVTQQELDVQATNTISVLK